jgi:hypothetical protein
MCRCMSMSLSMSMSMSMSRGRGLGLGAFRWLRGRDWWWQWYFEHVWVLSDECCCHCVRCHTGGDLERKALGGLGGVMFGLFKVAAQIKKYDDHFGG